MNTVPKQGFVAFGEEVFKYLEYLNYPDYVIDFDEEAVATSLHKAMFSMWLMNTSVRMTAIIIFSLTLEMQVIPTLKNQKVN